MGSPSSPGPAVARTGWGIAIPGVMLGKLIARINSRIAHKLALWVILFSMVITLMASAIQLYLAYRQDLDGIKEYFDSITEMQLNSLSQSVWIMDDRQIQAHLTGITKGRDIIYAAVLVDGKPRWASGTRTPENTLENEHRLTYQQRDAVYNLGTLKIVAGLDNLYARLSWTAFVILLTNGLKTFLFAGCILFYFRFAVTRHLERLATHVVNMDFRQKIKPLDLDRNMTHSGDEFTQVVNMLNILQRRGYHAFHAMEKSEQRLRLFFDATEEGIFGLNADGMITFANSSCLNMIERRLSQDIIGKRVDSLFSYRAHSENGVAEVEDFFFSSLRLGKTVSSDDGYLEVRDGPSFYASVRIYPIISEGTPTGAVVFFNDITEQREVLREKNLLSQAIRQSPLLIIIFDEEGGIDYVNPGFERLTGYRLREVIGKKPFFLGVRRMNIGTFRDIQRTLAAGEKWQGLYRLRAKDGSEHSFDTLVSPVFSSRGRIVNIIALFLDITQKVALQKQLIHAQKMEAVGRLSASFAHEFGNPLFGVRSVIKDISERVPMDDGDRQLLQLAYEECERMKILIHDFQRFQRSGSDVKEYHDIHTIIDNVLIFYKKHLDKNNIRLFKQYDAEIPQLFLSKNQIAQVFLNLFLNAMDSMGEGGTLEVATRRIDREVHIDVTDSGIGISEADRDLIFEPFYTTKPEVQGTGLGLSVSYGIISGHGGDITVSSTPNKGSVFTVRLPVGPTAP